MFNIGDTLQSKICPTMAGTIIKLDKNRAVIRITRTRYSKDVGRELVFEDCCITVEERKQAYKELKEYGQNQSKNIDKMLDDFLLKF